MPKASGKRIKKRRRTDTLCASKRVSGSKLALRRWKVKKKRGFSAWIDRTAIRFNSFLDRLNDQIYDTWKAVVSPSVRIKRKKEAPRAKTFPWEFFFALALSVFIVFYLGTLSSNEIAQVEEDLDILDFESFEFKAAREEYLRNVDERRISQVNIANKYGNVWIYENADKVITREHCEINGGKFSECEPRDCSFNKAVGDWTICSLDCSPACVVE